MVFLFLILNDLRGKDMYLCLSDDCLINYVEISDSAELIFDLLN
jgi:hypothetical protein